MFLIYRLLSQPEKSDYLRYVFNISTVCWGSRECETQINSAADWSAVLRDALWDIPGGRGKSRTQEIIKSVCSQKHSQMRLKQRISQFRRRWYLSRSAWESFEKFLQWDRKQDLEKQAAQPPGFKTQKSCDSTETPPSFPWLLSFSLMSGWETVPHMEDESLPSSFSSFCVLLKALG